jgi:hypothetical protein
MYKLTEFPEIIRLADNAVIPALSESSSYQAYLAWLAEGNTPLPADTRTEEEKLQAERQSMVVSRFQAFAALHIAGLLPAIEAMMQDPATDTLAKLAWVNALEFRRLSPTVTAIASALNLTDEQLDDLFRQAKLIEA